MVKYIIFDMDGVLIDAREWHYHSLNEALGHFGFMISRADHLLTYDGLPTKKKLKMLSQQSNLPSRLHSLINKLKQKYTVQMVVEECGPTFHHQKALSSLKERGYQLAVASNSIRATVDLMMKYSDLQRYLTFTLSNEDVTYGKPDPAIYNEAIARFDARPEECLIVEDNPHGIAAARASGAHVLEVSSPDGVTLEVILEKLRGIEKL